MRRNAALILAAASSPAAAFLKFPFLHSSAERSYQPAIETQVADPFEEQLALGWSPRPTDAPEARNPLLGAMLNPRQEYELAPGTCGFIVGTTRDSITCVSDVATCTSTNNHIGCCEPNQPCNIIKTYCIDYEGVQDGDCDLPDDFSTLCCRTSSRGACYTWYLSRTGDASTGPEETLIGCQPTSGRGTLLPYDPDWMSTAVRTTSSESETTSSSSSETDSSSSEAPTSSGDPEDDDDDDNDDGGDDGGSNVGAIAGGTVGGVAGIALIGAGIFFFLRRRKAKGGSSPSSSNANMSQYTAGPGGPQYGPVPGGPGSPGDGKSMYSSGVPPGFQGYPQNYDPNMAAYSQQQGYQYANQYPQQGYQYNQAGYGQDPYNGAYNYPGGSTIASSPPPQTTPSPGIAGMGPSPVGGTAPVHAGGPAPSELGTNHPVGNEHNRAELS